MTPTFLSSPGQGSVFNPKGIASFSPGLARLRKSLPWVPVIKNPNPERVAAHTVANPGATLSGLETFLVSTQGSLALLRQGSRGQATLGLITQSLRDWKRRKPKLAVPTSDTSESPVCRHSASATFSPASFGNASIWVRELDSLPAFPEYGAAT